MFGIILGVKQYVDNENMIAERIFYRLGVLLITSIPLRVSPVDFSKIGSPENYSRGGKVSESDPAYSAEERSVLQV